MHITAWSSLKHHNVFWQRKWMTSPNSSSMMYERKKVRECMEAEFHLFEATFWCFFSLFLCFSFSCCNYDCIIYESVSILEQWCSFWHTLCATEDECMLVGHSDAGRYIEGLRLFLLYLCLWELIHSQYSVRVRKAADDHIRFSLKERQYL